MGQFEVPHIPISEDQAVLNRISEKRTVWLAVGVVAGLCISYFWPHEPALAATNDRSAKFGLATVSVRDVTIAGVRESLDGVFVLDYLTGTLQGAVMSNKTGKFTHSYGRNLAADFKLQPGVTPQYAFVSGIVGLPSVRQVSYASGNIFVAELTSGMVHCYAFPWKESRGRVPKQLILLLDGFRFREAL